MIDVIARGMIEESNGGISQISEKVNNHTEDSDIHVTMRDKENWNSHPNDLQASGNPVVMDGLQEGVPFSEMVVSGKNLIPFPYYDGNSKTHNGITFTVNSDGTITANGTATATAIFYISTNYTIKKGIYTLSGCPKSESNTNYILQFATGDWSFKVSDFGNGATTQIDNDINLQIFRIAISSGVVCDNLVFRPQLELGDTATTYEPPITGRELTVNVCGKNLMKPNKSTVTLNGITATMNDDGSVALNGTATANTYIGMWNNLYARSIGVGKITINAIDGQSISTYFMGIDRREGSSYIDRIAQSITNNGIGEITQEDVENNRHFYVWVFIAANYTANNLVFRPQLELGDTATAYEPYHGSTTTITPTSNPYVLSNDIRQQDGLNVVGVSEGEISVTGVRKNAAIKRIWDDMSMDLLFDGTVTAGTNCITDNVNGYNFLYFYGNLSSVSGESGNVTGSLVIPKTARAISAGQSLVVTTGVIYITVNIINIESGVITFTVTPSDSGREIYEFKVFGIK